MWKKIWSRRQEEVPVLNVDLASDQINEENTVQQDIERHEALVYGIQIYENSVAPGEELTVDLIIKLRKEEQDIKETSFKKVSRIRLTGKVNKKGNQKFNNKKYFKKINSLLKLQVCWQRKS